MYHVQPRLTAVELLNDNYLQYTFTNILSATVYIMKVMWEINYIKSMYVDTLYSVISRNFHRNCCRTNPNAIEEA